MTEPILCLVAFFFLVWILILKSEINRMRKELERARGLMKTKLDKLEKHVEVSQGRSLKGRDAEGSLLRFP